MALLIPLLQIRPFVPDPNWLLSRVAEPGQNVPHAKIFFAPRGIGFQDLLSSAWFPCQLTKVVHVTQYRITFF